MAAPPRALVSRGRSRRRSCPGVPGYERRSSSSFGPRTKVLTSPLAVRSVFIRTIWTALAGTTGLGWAGGYVGDGVATTNLAGRTLRDLVLGRETALTRLPWVGHRSPRWEPEPLRWLGINTGLRAMTLADAEERLTGRPSVVARAVAPLLG